MSEAAGPALPAFWERFGRRWERPCFYLAVALAASTFFVPELNPDLFWHLSAGRHILQTQAVPRADFLSHTMGGKPWCDFEWLVQLLYYPVYRLGGYGGFIVLRAVLLGALMAVALSLLRLFRLDGWVRGAAVLFIMSGQNPSLRPDLFSLIFFGCVFWGLESLRRGDLKVRAVHLAACAGLFCLWANLHLGFAFGLLLIFFFAVGELIEAALPWIYGRDWAPLGGLKAFLALLAAAAAGTLLNPYGWKTYGVLLEHSRLLPVLQELIIEWRSADVTDLGTWPYWLLVVFSLSAALVHFIRTRRTSYAHLLTLAYFLVTSSIHVRHRTFFFLFAVPLSLWWVRQLRPGRLWAWALSAFGAAVAAAVLVGIARSYWPAIPAFSGTKWCSEPAWVMCRFLEREEQLKGKRLLNAWHHGGYLGFRLYPDNLVFFDGRYIFHDLLLETREAQRRPETWQALLDKYRVDVACLQRSPGVVTMEMVPGQDGKMIFGGKPFYQVYMPKAAWALVYWDDGNLVMVRRSSVDAAWLSQVEFQHLLPDVRYVDASARHLPLFRAELARHLRQTQGHGLEDRALLRWLGALLAGR